MQDCVLNFPPTMLFHLFFYFFLTYACYYFMNSFSSIKADLNKKH